MAVCVSRTHVPRCSSSTEIISSGSRVLDGCHTMARRNWGESKIGYIRAPSYTGICPEQEYSTWKIIVLF